MKILLDENLPKKLMNDIRLEGFNVSSVPDEKLKSLKNGELIQRMIQLGFTILLTFDQNLQYQQSLSKYKISVIVFQAKNNQYLTLKSLLPNLFELLKSNLENRVYLLS